jgi:hypothetical protein
MKIKKNILIFGIFMLFLMNFISAAPPVTTVQQFTEGYVIEDTPQLNLYKLTDFEVNFFVYNLSNGLLIDNTATECKYYLSNNTGEILHYTDVPYSEVGDYGHWAVTIKGDNFSYSGEYFYGIKCNSSTFGGAEIGTYYISPNGHEFTVQKAILFFFILSLLGVGLFFSISGAKKTTNGSWLIGYVSLTYILFYALIGISYLLAHNYLWSDMIVENILYIIWFIMGIGFLPFIIIITLYILGQEAKAALERNYLQQGYTRDEAKTLSKRKR